MKFSKKEIRLGIDVLLDNPQKWIKEERLALLCNRSSFNKEGRYTKDIIYEKFGKRLKVILTPQHGFWGLEEANMIGTDDSTDKKTGVRIVSLYGPRLAPPKDIMEEIDIIIIDLQDVGTRVYTYFSTVAQCLKAASVYGKKILILDRPNPLGGKIEGPILKKDLFSFVGQLPIPMRHGMTIGELALMYKDYYGIEIELVIVPMEGWNRSMLFPDTGLTWPWPSPNLPTFSCTLVYPGQVLIEGTNLSEGRGTTRPFEVSGAPFISPEEVANRLNSYKKFTGCTWRPIYFRPYFDKWKNEVCGGVIIEINDCHSFNPIFATLHFLSVVIGLYRDEFSWYKESYEFVHDRLAFDIISGNENIRHALEDNIDPREIEKGWEEEIGEFRDHMKNFFIY